MTLKEFLEESFDVDIEGTLTDDWVIAFIGPVKLTDEGKMKFAAILNNKVHLHGLCRAEIEVENEEEDELAQTFFYTAAGYCNYTDYQKYFLQ